MEDSEFQKTKEMCIDLCEELMSEIKKDEILHVTTQVVTKGQEFSTKATVCHCAE